MPKAPEEKFEDTPKPSLPSHDNSDLVWVTVTKFGAGQVSTGEHIAGQGEIYAERGDKLQVSQRVANSLEARGLAEMD